jgi:hypothetical protein
VRAMERCLSWTKCRRHVPDGPLSGFVSLRRRAGHGDSDEGLSGGLIPCSAVLMSDQVYEAVINSLKRSIVHASTFSENSMSMRDGLATLEVVGARTWASERW